jgi:hypothetical protein
MSISSNSLHFHNYFNYCCSIACRADSNISIMCFKRRRKREFVLTANKSKWDTIYNMPQYCSLLALSSLLHHIISSVTINNVNETDPNGELTSLVQLYQI